MIFKHLMRLRKSFSRGRLIADKRHISQLVIRLTFSVFNGPKNHVVVNDMIVKRYI